MDPFGTILIRRMIVATAILPKALRRRGAS
jgi:hypothetical protein